MRLNILFPCVLLCVAVSASASPQHKPKSGNTNPVLPEAQKAAAPQPAPAPATPEQSPSSPPQVTFQNGQLTIIATNSTMADVLNGVRQKTGAVVDMPAVSSERVVGRFGPGAPRDVMAQLLNGSHYDYVLLGSPSDPSALKRIVLTARPIGPEPASPPPNAAASAQNQPLQTVPEVENDQNGEDSFTPEVPPSDEDQAQPDQSQPDQSQSPPNGAPMVKTPEQLLREIEQQRQQQQNAQPPER